MRAERGLGCPSHEAHTPNSCCNAPAGGPVLSGYARCEGREPPLAQSTYTYIGRPGGRSGLSCPVAPSRPSGTSYRSGVVGETTAGRRNPIRRAMERRTGTAFDSLNGSESSRRSRMSPPRLPLSAHVSS